jgi:hypothetical protein
VFRNSTGYNESIETPAATIAPSSVRVKEFAVRYMCDSSDSDFKIAVLTSSTSIFSTDLSIQIYLVFYNLFEF